MLKVGDIVKLRPNELIMGGLLDAGVNHDTELEVVSVGNQYDGENSYTVRVRLPGEGFVLRANLYGKRYMLIRHAGESATKTDKVTLPNLPQINELDEDDPDTWPEQFYDVTEIAAWRLQVQKDLDNLYAANQRLKEQLDALQKKS